MKKITVVLIAIMLIFVVAACADGTNSVTTDNMASAGTTEPSSDAADETPQSEADSEQSQTSDRSAENGSSVLVVVFSATGTTKGVAEKIAAIENADLYEIKAAQEYTSADLNWNDSNSRTTIEQNDKSVRPEIGSGEISLDGYDTVYIGFPIWWGEEPRIMDTFVESHDFDGITVIPFCTSSSSGIGRSGQNLADNAKSGNWLDGRRFGGGVSEDELRSWIDGLK